MASPGCQTALNAKNYVDLHSQPGVRDEIAMLGFVHLLLLRHD